jgi:phosphoglucosamine mutase
MALYATGKRMKVENFFGTDGIRGIYGQYPLTPSDMWALGWAVGRWILDQGASHPFVFIGKDTRASGPAVEEALTGGLIAAGVRVVSIGCAPTPAVAFLTRAHKAAMGLMISASHNPAIYNGIKFFNTSGEKLSILQEKEISLGIVQAQGKSGLGIGATEEPHFLKDYEDFLIKNIPDIGPLRLVVDCAHGAYSDIAPRLLRSCGAIILDVLGASPDGQNINAECGAVHPQRLCHAVQYHQADAGISFDGDGDRVIIVNRNGLVQDGDQILAALAMAEISPWPLDGALLSEIPRTRAQASLTDGITQELLSHFGVVGTVLSNLGLENFLKAKTIGFVRTDVGDRWIAQKLKELHWTLGGEPCGHIILADSLPTGDGLLAGLHILHHMEGNPNLFPMFQPTPSIMRNVALRIPNFAQHPEFLEYNRTLQSTLDHEQRVLLRPSGTEPVLRILVEGPCQDYVAHLAGIIAQELDDRQKTLEKFFRA